MRDVSVSDLFKLVRRWWWVFILCPLLAGAAAYGVSSQMTKVYQGSATIYVSQSQTPGPADYNAIQAAQQIVGTYSRLATTRPVLEETITRLNLALTPEQLAKKVDVEPVSTTQLLRINVEDPSPALAASIANTLADVFITQTKQAQQAATGPSRDEIQRSIDATKKRIDDSQARLAELQRGPNASSAAVESQIQQLQNQINQDTTTYTNLLQAQQQMDLAIAQNGAQLRVAEPAVPPVKFVKPRIVLNIGLAVVLGLFVATGLVLVGGYVDDTVKSSDEVQRLTGRAALGSIPTLRSPDGIEAVAHPNAAATEAYRTMRTNFQFASAGQQIRSMVVTSFRPGDGKTTTSINLAAVLAQGGQRVILVDADLRKPRVHKHFSGMTTHSGLTNLVLSSADVNLGSLLQQTVIPGLRILPAGPLPPNPPDVLNSPRMRQIVDQLEAEADIVLFDAPPMAVSDALIIGGLVDRTLLVALQERTRTAELARAVRELEQIGTPLAGVVLNRVKLERSSHHYAYYRSYYGSVEQAAATTEQPGVATVVPQAAGSSAHTHIRSLSPRQPSRADQAAAPASATPPAKADWLTSLLLWCTKRSRHLAWLILPNSSGSTGAGDRKS